MALVKERILHSDSEKKYKNDKEMMIISTDEDKIIYEVIFHSRLRIPQDSDFQGIKSLLKEIFPSAHLDLDSLTRLIISQCIGLVLKQISSDDDNAEEINDPIDVYSVSTVVGVKQNVNCILQLREHLLILVNEYAPDSTKAEIKRIIEDEAIDLELLINERDNYLAAEMVIDHLEWLYVKMYQARCERLDSTYFIYICKIFKITEKKKEKILWINLDEKVMSKQATYSFEFSVDSELVNGLPNKSWIDGPDYWNPDDYDTAVPYRRVLVFEFSKLQRIINNVRKKLNYYDYD